MKSTRQGVYIRVNLRAARSPIYVGSVAGGRGRSFRAREKEHIRELDKGSHANGAMQKAHKLTGGQGWAMIPVAFVRKGDIKGARKIEQAIIRALGKGCCNERR